MKRVTRAEVESVEVAAGVHLAQLVAGDRTSVRHFFVEPGESIAEREYDHERAGYVTRGTLTFVRDDGEELLVQEGDSYLVPAGQAHAAENRGDAPVEGVDVFSPPRIGSPGEE